MLLLLLLRGSRRLLGDCEQLRAHRRFIFCLHRLPLVLVPPTSVWSLVSVPAGALWSRHHHSPAGAWLGFVGLEVFSLAVER